MCRLHAGKAACGGAGLPLQVGGQLIKLSACQANHCALLLLLLLCDDAHPATDGQGCPFVVPLKQKKTSLALASHSVSLSRYGAFQLTCDHDDSYASLSTHSDGTENFFSRGVQHAHTTYKGQIRLGEQGSWSSSASPLEPVSCLLQYSWTRLLSPHLMVNEGSWVLQVKAAQVRGCVSGCHSETAQSVSPRSPVS